MGYIEKRLFYFTEQYQEIIKKRESGVANPHALPANSYFLSDGSIMCLPRSKGVSRFPYGEDGFSFWTYDVGYIHANVGLFSTFLRAYEGEEPKIAFFAGKSTKKGYKPLSLLSVPYIDSEDFGVVHRYTVFDEVATYYITDTDYFHFGVVVFIDANNEMHFSLFVNKKRGGIRDFYLGWYFNPTLSYATSENNETRWFKGAEYQTLEDNPMGRFLFSINEDRSRYLSVNNFGILNQSLSGEDFTLNSTSATTSRKMFVGGENRSLSNAEALYRGEFPEKIHRTIYSDNAVAGQISQFTLENKANIRIDLLFNYKIHSLSMKSYESLYREISPIEFDDVLFRKQSISSELNRHVEVEFSDYHDHNGNFISSHVFSNFFRYLKRQVEFCATLSGYAQLAENSLIGVRDVFQAIEAHLFYREQIAREKIIEALNFLDPSGRAPRQYSLPVTEVAMPKMDLRPFIDQGLWIIGTIITYLKHTADFSILKEVCGYYEVIDGPGRIVRRSELRDSVFDHMFRIMDYLIDNIDTDTNCLRALYGDWVDALDGLGVSISDDEEYGNGVSVMASLQLYKILGEMIELMIYTKAEHNIIERYTFVRSKLQKGIEQYAIAESETGEKRILHGWGDKRSYFVGSFEDSDGQSRHSVVVNAYWILSDMFLVHDELKDCILNAFKCLTSKYGFRTFTPAFEAGTYGVGRIHKLTKGTAENGATYVHGATFGVSALFRIGEAKLAWEELYKLLPLAHDNITTSPFVMPNSYGHNPELNIDGESMHDWQTGSSNMVMKILIFYVFGLRFEYDAIIFQAANYCPFDSWQISLNYQGKRLTVKYQNEKLGSRKFRVNGVRHNSVYDAVMKTETMILREDSLDSSKILVEIVD